MATRTSAPLGIDALSLEGALLPPEWLARVAALEAPAQSPADYGVPKGLQLRDEIGRYWRIAEALWGEFVAARGGADPAGAARRLAHDLLSQVFGFGDVTDGGERTAGGRTFALAFEVVGGRVPVIVGPPTEGLDQSVQHHGDGHRRRSAWGALQEFLNASEGALWGVATNGTTLRLGRDNASLTRPAWLEADLERIFAEERFADFSVLWLLLHASRFGRADQGVHDAPLERWREAGREEGSRAREALRVGVEEALRDLGQGFVAHPANGSVRAALADGSLAPTDYFNELLRLVYRMIFLLTVEERGILHAPGADTGAVTLYGTGYGMRRLRERSLRHAAHDGHGDLWASLRPVFAGLARPGGEPALGLPGLGGLFGTDQCPHLDAAALENRALLAAVFRLSWLREGRALARVNWKDMGVEEFGSVYESLLELVPVVTEGGRRFGFAGEGETAGNARKLTGSYYTPDALVQQLLDTALEPVVAQRLAEHPDPADAERALLSLAVVDPACGSGHFLLAAARRLAGHLARLRAGGTPGAAEYRHALRDVVTHCIHGVDRNPMALELARMALWLEAYTPDRALGFLDHHLVCGDALLGLLELAAVEDGIPDEAFKALTGDDKDVAKLLVKLNRAGRKALEAQRRSRDFGLALGTQSLGDAWAALDALADHGLAGVEAKRAAYARLRSEADADPRAVAADLFVGAFLMPKTLADGERALTEGGARARFPSTSALLSVLDGTMGADHTVVQAARRACRASSVMHWPLAFPQVFARGGFDVVLGNPPWEVSQLGEEEFFAVRAPQVAQARNKAAREREIERLAAADDGSPERRAYEEYAGALRLSEAVNRAYRGNPRFALTAVGKLNTYPLFAESMYRMTRPGGRAGFIVPSGIATDDTTKEFFGEIANTHLVSLLDFRTGRGLFSEIGHQRYKFCLLTLGQAAAAEFAFGMTEVQHVRDPRRRFTLSSDEIALLNPNTRTCPIFRTAMDAELTKKIYQRVPVLIDESHEGAAGNPWGVSFSQGLFNMATDSGLFLDTPAPGALPLYEAKMIHQFEHRWATYDAPQAGAEPDSRTLTSGERADPAFAVRPRYWVNEREVTARLEARGWTRRWLMGWRDICRATDERTTIVGLMPRVAVGHTMPLFIAPERSAADVALLLANLNSVVLDYVARQKVGGTHLTYGFLRQFPVLAPTAYGATQREFVVPRVLELTYTAYDLAPWARDLGHDGPPFRWDPDRRALLRAELDAWYAHAYGLTRDELRYVLDPADVMGIDWPSETFRVLKTNEEREFGEYRTRRLVLQAWDALVAGLPMPSALVAPAAASAADAFRFVGRPEVAPTLSLASSVLALVRAAGGPLAVPELARALALRARPAGVLELAPPAIADYVAAWAGVTVREELPAGALPALLDQLVDRQALRWHLTADGLRALVPTEHTPAWDTMLPWYRDEAKLLLQVLAGLAADARTALDEQLPASDRATLRLHVG